MKRIIALGRGALKLTLHHETVKNNNMPKCHSHDEYELYFLLEGRRELFVDGGFVSVERGDVFLIPPGVEHRTLDLGAGEYSRLTCMFSSEALPVGKLPTDGIYFVRPDGASLNKMYSLARAATDSPSELAAYSAFVRMLDLTLSLPRCETLDTAESPVLRRVAEILGYIDAHYTESINLTMLAKRFYISEYHLCRLFKRCTGKTVMAYVNSRRLSRARLLLETTELGVGAIARESGFGSVSAFGSAFKSGVGCSPREYRASN